MTPKNDVEFSELIPVKSEMVKTYRQTIRPPRVQLEGILPVLGRMLRAGKFTGKVTINVIQGGIRDIITEQVPPDGASFSEDAP